MWQDERQITTFFTQAKTSTSTLAMSSGVHLPGHVRLARKSVTQGKPFRMTNHVQFAPSCQRKDALPHLRMGRDHAYRATLSHSRPLPLQEYPGHLEARPLVLVCNSLQASDKPTYSILNKQSGEVL